MRRRDKKIPDLVCKAEAADILGTNHQAVQQMIDNGRIAAAQVGTTWVIRRAEVERIAPEVAENKRRQEEARRAKAAG